MQSQEVYIYVYRLATYNMQWADWLFRSYIIHLGHLTSCYDVTQIVIRHLEQILCQLDGYQVYLNFDWLHLFQCDASNFATTPDYACVLQYLNERLRLWNGSSSKWILMYACNPFVHISILQNQSPTDSRLHSGLSKTGLSDGIKPLHCYPPAIRKK